MYGIRMFEYRANMIEKVKKQEIQEHLLTLPYVLYRESLPEIREALEDLCGLLNTEMAKGVLLLGIAPGKKIRGIKKANWDSIEKILQAELEKFNPPVFSMTEIWQVEGDDECFLIKISADRSREVPLYEFGDRAFLRDGAVTRQLNSGEKRHIIKERQREFHNGPWKCNQCGLVVKEIPKVTITEWGIQRSYACPCGGEFYPA